MAIDLTRIQKGRLQRPPRVVLYSAPGVGKTSWAIGAPNPFLLDANKGSAFFDTRRLFVEDWEETYEWLTAIEEGKIDCETVVLETVRDFEAMSHAKLFPGSTVSKHDGGWGKGDDVVVMEWRKMLYRLERLWERGKGIIITAHAIVKRYESPVQGAAYDRFLISARPQLGDLLSGWSDYTFFAQINETVAVTDKNKPNKGRAGTTGERYLFTRRHPAYDAKARGTAAFPEVLPLSYEAFAAAVRADGARVGEMQVEIDEMLKEIGDKKLTEEVRSYIKKWPTQIADAHNRVKIRLSEKKEAPESAVQAQQETATNASGDPATA